MNDPMLINASEVASILSVNKKTFYLFLKSKEGEKFPKPIRFGERLKRWRRNEVEAWANGSTEAGV